jgi:ankyrin repeat protein
MRVLVILLLLASASAQDLHRLAGEGLEEEIRAAIEDAADPDARDAYGQTPLMYAVDHQQLEAVQALLHEGANVNAQSDPGWTSLMYSSREAWSGWFYAELLLLHGADPRLRNAEGQTARDIAKDAVRQVTLLEAAELLHEALEPGSLEGVASARTDHGYFAAGIVDYIEGATAKLTG